MGDRRQILFLLLILGFTISVSGQEPVSLTNDGLVSWTDKGYYLGLIIANANIAEESVRMNGIELGYVYKHWFSTGLSFYSHPTSILYKKHYYNFILGGPIIQLMYKPQKLFFSSVGTSCGIGNVNEDTNKKSVFFFLAPELRLWFNVSSFMRLSLKTAYRFTNKSLASIETSGWIFEVSVVYGKF